MWSLIKWTVVVVILLAITAVLHYHIPRREVVRVLANEIIRVDYETTNAQGEPVTRTRDVRQIYAEEPDGETMEFNNTDAPLYLKFDSANLTAKAEQLVSRSSNQSNTTPVENKWAVVTYYGWRIEFLSWFPNAIDIRRAEGPEENLLPWHWIAIGIVLVVLLVLWRLLVLQISRFTDPVIEELEYEDEQGRGYFARQFRRIGKRLRGT
ncbi:MAG: DUF1523 family protein [Paracoccaceae bacterium]